MATTKATTTNTQPDLDQPKIDDILEQGKTKQKPATETPKQPKTDRKKTDRSKGKLVSQTTEDATAKAAKDFVKAEKQSKQLRVQTGYEIGLKEAQDIATGKQLGLIQGLTHYQVQNTLGLREKLKACNDLQDQISEEDNEDSDLQYDPENWSKSFLSEDDNEDNDPIEMGLKELKKMSNLDDKKKPKQQQLTAFDFILESVSD